MPGPRPPHRNHRHSGSGRSFGRRSSAAASLVAALIAIIALAPRTTAAEPQAICLSAASTTSTNGQTLFVSPCGGEVVVTSPLVRTIYGSSAADVIHAGPNVETIYGGEGNDEIYAGPSTTLVEGGAGEDKIYGEPLSNEVGPEPEAEGGSEAEYIPAPTTAPATTEPSRASAEAEPVATASSLVTCTENPCLGGTGDQELHGGAGNDEIFGQRGDDALFGEAGNDALYGGIGDDKLYGGIGNDFLAGGPGADLLEGGEGNDLLRGDGTTDTINGNGGTDTVSFSTGVTPGFEGAYPSGVKHVSGFPEAENGEGRGVYVRLDGTMACGGFAACDGGAGLGGGDDTITVGEVENVIGTPFPDVIVGSSGANQIYGGGGGDVIIGGGGADELFGGAEGDYIEDSGSGTAYGGKGSNDCSGLTTVSECTGTEAKVTQHEAATMSAGLMMTTNPAVGHDTVYLVGSEGEDDVNAHYLEGESAVTFTSYGPSRFAGESEGCTYELEGTKATCRLPVASSALDAVVMAGMAGDDHLAIGGEAGLRFPLTASPILLGGEGNDELLGSNTTEDVLVDGNGAGNDIEKAYAYDDWLLNNGGTDVLEGGEGNDLLLSTAVCGGDTLQGAETGRDDGAALNDASWAKLPAPAGVTADINTQSDGSYWNEATESPGCTEGSVDHLYGIDDLEGSNQNDALFGGEHDNLIIGHLGEDNLRGEGGDDHINSQDGAKDKVNGGPQSSQDECAIDLPLDEVSGCEKTIPDNSTSTTISEPEAHNGSLGSVNVKGNVAASGSLSGTHVLVEFEKLESGSWILKDSDETALSESGNYTRAQSVGVGSWRVRAAFPAQGDYKASASGYHPFTISK